MEQINEVKAFALSQALRVQIADRRTRSDAQNFYTSVGYHQLIEPDALVIIGRIESKIIGVVRLTIEHGHRVLRGMQVDPNFQRQRLGTKMLQELERHMGSHECFCLPHGWLEGFYGQIGFKKISEELAPPHLRERLLENRKKRPQLIVMKRASTSLSDRPTIIAQGAS